MRRIVLLRHGMTSWNKERRFQGQADIELTETGQLQASAAALALQDYAPTRLLSSDLARALQTAEHVAEVSQLVPVLDERLREVHVGDLQGLTHAEVVERYGHGPWDFSEYGGESTEELADRAAAVIAELADALDPGETAIVVAHGASLRAGLLRFLGWPLDHVLGLAGLDNCGWVELIDAPGAGHPDAVWRLAAYNRVAPIS